MDRADAAALSLRRTIEGSARGAAGVPGQDDRLECAAGDAPDWALLAQRTGAGTGVSAASLRAAVWQRRYRVAGRSGGRTRKAERTSYQQKPQERGGMDRHTRS